MDRRSAGGSCWSTAWDATRVAPVAEIVTVAIMTPSPGQATPPSSLIHCHVDIPPISARWHESIPASLAALDCVSAIVVCGSQIGRWLAHTFLTGSRPVSHRKWPYMPPREQGESPLVIFIFHCADSEPPRSTHDPFSILSFCFKCQRKVRFIRPGAPCLGSCAGKLCSQQPRIWTYESEMVALTGDWLLACDFILDVCPFVSVCLSCLSRLTPF